MIDNFILESNNKTLNTINKLFKVLWKVYRMRIVRKDIKHKSITVVPETLDDLWVLYNVIFKGDKLFAKTSRQKKIVDGYAQTEKGKRISIFLGLTVERISWDQNLNRLRILGIICMTPEKISIKGLHHSLNIELNSKLRIVKENWLKYQIAQIDEASKSGYSPLIVMSIDDEGYCIAVIRNFKVHIREEARIIIPGKAHAELRTGEMGKLFKTAMTSLARIWSKKHYSIVVVGLGFIKDKFIKYMETKTKDLLSAILDVKGINSTGIAGINEALRSGILTKSLHSLRISQETEAVEELLKRLGKDKTTVTYGIAEVNRANLLGAIDKLLLTDTQLREVSDEERIIREKIMKDVVEKGGKVIIISTEHEAGDKLHSLGGIAALLRFPLFQSDSFS